MKQRLLQLSYPLIVTAMLGIGYYAGQMAVNKQAIRDAEYERVVLRVAETYGRDPSEIEVECGLTDASGKVLR